MGDARTYAGVDEAGLGPLLGPLCIGFAAFGVDQTAGPVSLRRALRGAVVGEHAALARNDPRVRVCDSKKLHKGARKMEQLERTALAFFQAFHGLSREITIQDFFQNGLTTRGALERHPWYSDLALPLPIAADRRDIQRAARRIRSVCDYRKIKILDIGVRVVAEGEYNDMIDLYNNKSIALFHAASPALRRISAVAKQNPMVVCDRQGGRASYAPLLSEAFSGDWVQIVREGRKESLYIIKTERGPLKIAFAEKGERRSMSCALASIFAKYARELSMHLWNRYFSGVAPAVRPTAGYYVDAMRYLKEAGPALKGAGIDPRSLVRSR